MKNLKKAISLFIAAVLLTTMMSGQAAAAAKMPEAPENGITVTDQAGREVTLQAPAACLVSSYYISTAILIALGCEDDLKGIEMKADTRELYKLAAPQLLDLPAVGSGKGIYNKDRNIQLFKHCSALLQPGRQYDKIRGKGRCLFHVDPLA